jgi:toxin ParE1/3/4
VRVVWAPEAEQDRDDIWFHVSAENPSADARMDELFSVEAARLGSHSKLGHPGKIAGTRELIPHESYRLVYEVHDATVWLLALVHTAQQWPPLRER